MLKCPITFNHYDKISDDLYFLGMNTVLRFNVTLSKKTEDGKKYSFHHEYIYDSNKYIDYNQLGTIRRQFDFFLTIENLKKNQDGIKEYIMIRVQDIIYIQDCFNEASMWFRDKKYRNLFASKDNKIIMLGKVDPIIIGGLPMDKYMTLEPIVINYENNISLTGVRLTLSSSSNYVDIPVDRFMGLLYLINNINMYESAQLLLNYMQRPEYGTNSYSFEREFDMSQEHSDFVETKSKRKVQVNNKRQKSFFDKMDEL